MISDHGFQEQRKDFHINKWLIDQGYLRIKTGTGTEISRWEEIGRLEGRSEHAAAYMRRSSPSRFLVRLGLTRQKLRKVIPRAWWSFLKGLMPGLQDRIPESAEASYDVDWEHTQASAYQLFGMESKAVKVTIVDQASREKLCSELVEKLEQLRDPHTGDRFVRRAYRREELYAGPYVDQAPDIVLDLHDGYNITNSFFAADYVTHREQVRGCHHREGIFVASGDGILSGKVLGSPPSLLDVMPSVLHYLGLPIPNDCDGEVLREIFDPDSEVYKREVLREEMLWKERVTDGSLFYDEGERAEIEERLRALGYL
jgi:predicted AlkP superfamily phosphohydrolase/phosphomutase